ncbi:BAG family molecular chaperone regulator 2 [Folsomia candida]|uniref:BAG family molecular chaperone regulator 2 n=1 Tax=Folsomia candida TaxID=158441 RepID=A0A226E321_FOLCA|nr:BAG family molecular chaperone regulator 2 [Folsomia candida]OXA51311.1 BAG family molecular chaperone regulator 2 [Folsomia candida]
MDMDIPSEVVERSAKDTNNDHNDNDMSQSEMTKQQDAKCDGVVKSPDVGDDMSQDVTEVCSQEEDRTSAANSGFLTVIKMLDEMDERVEKLRSDATTLINEKDEIVSSLETLRLSQIVDQFQGNELDEIKRYLDRIGTRCKAVSVGIRTERSPPQLESLSTVNNMIDSLIRQSKDDPFKTQRKCVTYINTCSEQVVLSGGSIPEIDSKFESAVLGCTIEDQKQIKKRLTGLFSYFKSTTRSFAVMEEDEEVEEVINVNEAIVRSFQQQ